MDKLILPEKNTEDAVTSDKNQKARRFSLMDDMVSKFIFNDPADPWTPLGFLQAMRLEYPMSDIQLHSREMIARFPADKTIRYDVHGIINNTLLFDMEFQRYGNARDQERRIAYYLTRLFNAQELRGKSFDQLKPAWLILVADWPDDDVPFEQSLTNILHLSILNVGRCFLFENKPVGKLTVRERWALVFQYVGDPAKKELIHQIIDRDKNCERAVLKMATWSSEVLAYIQETRERGLELEMNQWKCDMRKEALAEGRLIKLIGSVMKKAKKGLSAIEIADDLDEDGELIRCILTIIRNHPDWSIKQITAQVLKTWKIDISPEYIYSD